MCHCVLAESLSILRGVPTQAEILVCRQLLARGTLQAVLGCLLFMG